MGENPCGSAWEEANWKIGGTLWSALPGLTAALDAGYDTLEEAGKSMLTGDQNELAAIVRIFGVK